MAVCGKKDVSGCDFPRGGEDTISRIAGGFGRVRRGMNFGDGHVRLEIQGSGFDE